jgi:phosphatidylglycerophosphate synthase
MTGEVPRQQTDESQFTRETTTANVWKIPNVLSFTRLAASPLLVVLALADLPSLTFALALVLFGLDWLDGKLATWLRQSSVFGAWLDSFADATFYGCVLLALVVLRWDVIEQEAVWIGLAIGSYAASVVLGLCKFRRVPNYHTRLAKTASLLMLIAVTAVFADWSVWLLRIAMTGVVGANLEGMVISIVLPAARVDVPSVFHVLQNRCQPSHVVHDSAKVGQGVGDSGS